MKAVFTAGADVQPDTDQGQPLTVRAVRHVRAFQARLEEATEEGDLTVFCDEEASRHYGENYGHRAVLRSWVRGFWLGFRRFGQ